MDNSKLNILIVDDYATMRRIVRNLLSQIDIARDHIGEATDGRDALSELRAVKQTNGPYDLIISDVEMPSITGLELAERVKNDPGLKDTKFLMMTSSTGTKHFADIQNSGADGYLVKPFNAEKLLTTITGLFADQPAADVSPAAVTAAIKEFQSPRSAVDRALDAVRSFATKVRSGFHARS